MKLKEARVPCCMRLMKNTYNCTRTQFDIDLDLGFVIHSLDEVLQRVVVASTRPERVSRLASDRTRCGL
eukprot:m.267463 g.267463  ORF g.267463 m.267463 type:complete len:69 (+) comp26783_c0_seq1:207-413(+)